MALDPRSKANESVLLKEAYRNLMSHHKAQRRAMLLHPFLYRETVRGQRKLELDMRGMVTRAQRRESLR